MKIFAIFFFILIRAIPIKGQQAKVYIFLSAKCPCAYNHQELVKDLEKKYKLSVKFTAVFVDKSDDVEEINDMMKNLGWKMETIKDRNKVLFRLYHPKVYTDCVLVSAGGKILYHGAIDDSPANMGQVKNFYLQNAIDDLLNKRLVKVQESKGFGCLIVN